VTSPRAIASSRPTRRSALRRTAAAGAFLALLLAAVSACAATAAFVDSDVFARIDGGTVSLFAAGIKNNTNISSGPLRLELWAASVPPIPSTVVNTVPTQYKLAQLSLGVLGAGQQFNNVTSPSMTLGSPPDGVWYYIVYLTEFTGAAGNDGYTADDFVVDLSGVTIGTPPPPPPPSAPTAVAVEYYQAQWGFYFVTAFPDEIAFLDGGAFGGAWQRTGETFLVWPQAIAGSLATCRFFSDAFAPKSTHFYTPFASECAVLKTEPVWAYEGIAFYVQPLLANGLCATGTVPLYRLYNNSMGGAPNHRYTTSVTTLEEMLVAGWSFEGNGVTRAFACVAG